MAVNSAEEDYDAYSVVILPDEGTAGPRCKPQLAFLSPVEVPTPLKSQLSLDTQLNNQNYINLVMENAVAYSSCILDVDIEKGKSETPKSTDEPIGNLKDEDPTTKSLQKQISFEMGGKYLQLLMNHSLMLPKFTTRDKFVTERVLDGPNNRSRKYKRSTSFNSSFNSRKVVLLFSVLSSMGTLILIYLTLRVRQIADGSVHA